MTAVPDPRFRDQLAETLRSHRNLGIREGEWTCACGRQFSVLDGWLIHRADALLPVIAAEVEARVQAAAAQRAAEDGSLRCTYCGGGALRVNTETEGRPYLTYEVPESIECPDCEATWETTGALRDPAKWVRYPDLYEPPAALAQPADGATPPPEEGDQ